MHSLAHHLHETSEVLNSNAIRNQEKYMILILNSNVTKTFFVRSSHYITVTQDRTNSSSQLYHSQKLT